MTPHSKSPKVEIRKAKKGDWSFIRKLCCETGNSGDPIEKARFPFFAEFWIGPYEMLLPQWAYVAVSGGKRIGYLTGCPDTPAFERWKRMVFHLPLFFRSRVLRRFPRNSDVIRFEDRFLKKEKSPEECFPSEVRARIRSGYPAHLHVNLSEEARGMGAGRRLVDAFVTDLREQAIPGLHVYCGVKPVGFYLKTGFQELGKIEFKPGVWVYALGLKTGSA